MENLKRRSCLFSFDLLDRILCGFMVFLVVGMVFSVSAEIVIREGLPISTPWVSKASPILTTLSQLFLVWVGLLGSALALRKRAHIGVDALVSLYPPRVRLLLEYVSTSLIALFSLAVLVVGGILVCQEALKRGSGTPGLPHINIAWFYMVLPLTGLLNLLYCYHQLRHPAALEGRVEEGGEDLHDA